VTYFHQSAIATATLNDLCKGAKSKLQQEVSTRWNSTYIMIKSLLSLKTEVDKALKAMDRLDLVLTDMEWATLAGAAIILKPFDDVTTDLNSQYYPSISKVIPSIKILLHSLTTMITTEFNPVLKTMLSALQNNLTRRFIHTTEQSTAHMVSTYLDPR
jgi:hypothetical protein